MFTVNEEVFDAKRVGELIKDGWKINDFKTISTHTQDEPAVQTQELLKIIGEAVENRYIGYYHIPDHNEQGFEKKHFGWYVKMYNEHHSLESLSELNKNDCIEENQHPITNFTA